MKQPRIVPAGEAMGGEQPKSTKQVLPFFFKLLFSFFANVDAAKMGTEPQSLLGLSGSALTRNKGKGLQSCWGCGGIVQWGKSEPVSPKEGK